MLAAGWTRSGSRTIHGVPSRAPHQIEIVAVGCHTIDHGAPGRIRTCEPAVQQSAVLLRRSSGLSRKRPRQDSNLRSRLRRAVLYPLSYGGSGGATVPAYRGADRRGPADRRSGAEVGRRRRRYPWPVTPEQLSDPIVDALAALVDEGAITPARRRARRRSRSSARGSKEHGDYATNVALQLAKPAGHRPREVADAASPSGCAAADGIAGVEVAGPGFLNITVDGRRAGRASPRTIVAAGRGVRPQRRAGRRSGSTSSSSRPTRPARCTSATPGGRRSATRSARLLEAAGAEVDPGVLLQRPRRADRPVRRVAAGRARTGEPVPEDGYRGAYIDDIAAAGRRRATRTSSTCPTTRRRRPSASAGVRRCMFDEIKQTARTTSASTSTSGSPSTTCTSPAPSSTALDAAARAGPRLRGGRRGLAAHHRLRRRQGPGADPSPTASRPTSPPTAPTTSTSASAASTAASTCSAPTTTATSAG